MKIEYDAAAAARQKIDDSAFRHRRLMIRLLERDYKKACTDAVSRFKTVEQRKAAHRRADRIEKELRAVREFRS